MKSVNRCLQHVQPCERVRVEECAGRIACLHSLVENRAARMEAAGVWWGVRGDKREEVRTVGVVVVEEVLVAALVRAALE